MPITSSVKFMFKKEFKAFVLSIEYETAIGKIMRSGLEKTPSGRPGQVDFPFGQVTYSPYLPHGQGLRQTVR